MRWAGITDVPIGETAGGDARFEWPSTGTSTGPSASGASGIPFAPFTIMRRRVIVDAGAFVGGHGGHTTEDESRTRTMSAFMRMIQKDISLLWL